MSHTSESLLAAASWAEVRAHDQIVRYRRSGSGRSLLLLCPDATVSTLWPELVELLDRDFRVLVPVVPPAAQLIRGLTGFLEGLGTSRIAVVATDAMCLAALELALFDTERIARALFVPCTRDELLGLEAALAAPARDPSVPLLVVPRTTAAAIAVGRIAAFLGDAWG